MLHHVQRFRRGNELNKPDLFTFLQSWGSQRQRLLLHLEPSFASESLSEVLASIQAWKSSHQHSRHMKIRKGYFASKELVYILPSTKCIACMDLLAIERASMEWLTTQTKLAGETRCFERLSALNTVAEQTTALTAISEPRAMRLVKQAQSNWGAVLNLTVLTFLRARLQPCIW